MLLGVAASGCGLVEDLGLQRNPNPTNLFDVFTRPSPGQAARWAVDPFNADHRFRGTSLLASAPFAGDEVYLAMFEANSADPDPAVRAAAVRGLAHHGDPSHVPLIVDRLSDEDTLVRLAAARALQRIHNPEAVPALLRRLDEQAEPEHAVRAACAHALGQYPQRRVLDSLAGALRDRSLSVNVNAREALVILTGRDDLSVDPEPWFRFVSTAEAPFEQQSRYRYPVFQRDRRLVEFVPLYPAMQFEPSAEPIGLPRVER